MKTFKKLVFFIMCTYTGMSVCFAALLGYIELFLFPKHVEPLLRVGTHTQAHIIVWLILLGLYCLALAFVHSNKDLAKNCDPYHQLYKNK